MRSLALLPFAVLALASAAPPDSGHLLALQIKAQEVAANPPLTPNSPTTPKPNRNFKRNKEQGVRTPEAVLAESESGVIPSTPPSTPFLKRYTPPSLDHGSHHHDVARHGAVPDVADISSGQWDSARLLPGIAPMGMRKFSRRGEAKVEVEMQRESAIEGPGRRGIEVEERDGEQYAYQVTTTAYSSDGSSGVSASASGTTTAQGTVASAASTAKTGGYFYGASSYYLFALADTERHAVLDALAEGGFKVVRIFVASVEASIKGSNNVQVDDLEPSVGTYDDTILELIDQLMVDCSARGLKLIIALSDRYALGFWSTDAYARKFNIVSSGSSGAQKVADASTFYTSSSAISNFDNRLTHILQHQNALLGNATWANLSSVIYAFEPQNEPQGHMSLVAPMWSCARAAHLKSLLPASSPILTSSGGGITLDASLGSWATSCGSFDIVSVHDYGWDAAATVDAIVAAKSGVAKGKEVILGEWGMMGGTKAALITEFVEALRKAGISHMYWEITKPGKGAADFEVWTDEPAWKALTAGETEGVVTSREIW